MMVTAFGRTIRIDSKGVRIRRAAPPKSRPFTLAIYSKTGEYKDRTTGKPGFNTIIASGEEHTIRVELPEGETYSVRGLLVAKSTSDYFDVVSVKVDGVEQLKTWRAPTEMFVYPSMSMHSHFGSVLEVTVENRSNAACSFRGAFLGRIAGRIAEDES